MKRILLFSILVPTYVVAQDHSGYWKGEITLPNAKLGFAVHLIGKDDSWAGTIDIPTQGLRGFALSNVKVEGQRVRFRMSGIPGEPSFDGKLGVSGKTIEGTFQQGPQSFRFSLQRAKRKADPAESGFDAIHPIAGEGAEGKWSGILEVGPAKLRMVLHVSAAKDGVLKAILDSLDQGAKIPIDTMVLKAKKLDFKIGSIQASFSGNLKEDGSAVEGIWRQSGRQLPLTFYRIEKTSK